MAEAGGGETHELSRLLSRDGRDYLVRNNGDKVKVGDLEGKTVGIYFSAHWCPPCRRFTPKLAGVYAELSPKGFEIIFVSSDRDEQAFRDYFGEMPWLAVPYSDVDARQLIKSQFRVRGIPHLAILDGGTGRVLTDSAVAAVIEHGEDAYPFTPARLSELEEAEKAERRNQTIRSVLARGSRDFLVKNNGEKVPISDLEGKIVLLYFSSASYPPSAEFTPSLRKMYEELKKNGEEGFEVVLVSLEDDALSFEEDFGTMPWLAVPFGDRSLDKLPRYFELRGLPTLVVIGPDGKTLCDNAAELVAEHRAGAYPFTAERRSELERARAEAQTLQSLLVSGDLDFVVGKEGVQVPVSDLAGKNILLYFSAHWCPPCRGFTPTLIQVYHEIKARDSAFELIFVSRDHDRSSFDEYFSGMPWLALPLDDPRGEALCRKFKIRGIPSLAAIGPSGRTVTTEARGMVAEHGAEAYPFTEERVKQLDQAAKEMAKGWPEKVEHKLHGKHELVRTRRREYVCDGCQKGGRGWSFYCAECDFDLHPECALRAEEAAAAAAAEGKSEPVGDKEAGYVCDGEVCRKA